MGKQANTLLRRKNPPVQKIKEKTAALKKQVTTDRVIDFSVDVGIVAFDVLSSPILIVARIVRYYARKFVNKYLKRFIKWFVHRVLRIK
tara:strand:- start:331 stop:597 length:267 start_codon:yes stop_codon:yes gene_type:complete